MVIGIQAFSGSTCGTLTEIGCAKSAGPSSGVQLALNGLNPSQLYYFRIYGSSHTNPQRTGIYCFCGTQGVQAYILPLSLESLKAVVKGQQVELNMLKPAAGDDGIYEIEYSPDAVSYQSVYRVIDGKTSFTHSPQNADIAYYRLKRSVVNGRHHYSAVVKVVFQQRTALLVFNNQKKELSIETIARTNITITDLSGRLLKSASLAPGKHRISTASLAAGIYLAHNSIDNQSYKFLVQK